jgi:hypothetical protein
MKVVEEKGMEEDEDKPYDKGARLRVALCTTAPTQLNGPS